MKKTTIMLAAAFAAVTFFASWAASSSDNAAVVIKDIGCVLLDGDGASTWADASHAVITSNGNGSLTCRATGVANSTGKAVVYTDLPCGTPAGVTTGRETVSASGQATLTCQVK